MWRWALLAASSAANVFACGNGPYRESLDVPTDGGSDTGATLPDGGGADAREDPDAGASPDADADAGILDAGRCEAGYQSQGELCELANPFQDPMFQLGTPWTTAHGASILTTTAGADNLGVGRLASDPDISHGSVTQTITIPDAAANQRLAIEGVFTADSPNSIPRQFLGVFSDGLPLNDWPRIQSFVGTERYTFVVCLGEAALFGPHAISFRGLGGNWSRFDLDHVRVAPNSVCPPLASIPNGDFESGGGWAFEGGQVQLASGVGSGGSRGLRFQNLTQKNEASRLVSIPSVSMKSPALQFHASGKARFHIALDGHLVARRAVDSTGEVMRACLPEWSRGVVSELTIGSGGSGKYLHDEEDGRAFVIDDLELVNDDTCSSPAWLENRDFENTDASVPGWFVNGGSGYTISRGTTAPHGGSGYLALHASPRTCIDDQSRAFAHQVFRYPPFDPTKDGMRLRFWYRHDAGLGARARAEGDQWLSLPPTGGQWHEVSTCLDRGAPGSRMGISFELDAISEPCESASLDIDDVVVEPTADCF